MPQLFRPHIAVLALLLSRLLGCSDATAPAACDGRLDIVVASGVTPIISWSPNCGISALEVFREPIPFSSGGVESPVWGFTVSERTPIGPGIRYGSAPRGANVLTAAQTLQTGAEYRVLVTYTVGGDGVVATGERLFVP